MLFNILGKPSVTAAVRSLEKALVRLEKAEAEHRARAEEKNAKARELLSEAFEEELAADRADRIRTKLSDLLV